MIIKVKSSQLSDAWYSDAIGFEFEVYVVPEAEMYYFVNPFLPIFKFDAEIIEEDEKEKIRYSEEERTD